MKMAAQRTDRLIVKYKNEVYDISEFRGKHPGGVNTLNGLMNADIGHRFDNAPPHSAAARYLMQEYRITSATDKNDNEIDASTDKRQGDGNVSYSRVNANAGTADMDLCIQTDDSMEVCNNSYILHFYHSLIILFSSFFCAICTLYDDEAPISKCLSFITW